MLDNQVRVHWGDMMKNTIATSPADTLSVKKNYPKRDKLNRRFSNLRNLRRDYEDRWKAIRDYQLPFVGEFENTSDSIHPGRRRDNKIAQGVAWMSAQIFAAGVMSGLTPPSRQWFKFSFSNSDLNSNVDVLKVLDRRQEILSTVLAKSNFYNSVHAVYLELPFGQCPLAIYADQKSGVRFVPMTIGTYFVDVDGYGKVNTIARRYELTVAQLVDNFGVEALPSNLRQEVQRGSANMQAKRKVYWLCEPNDKAIPGRIDNLNMPYKSVYWLEGSNEDEYLYVGGFEEFPAPVARYLVNGLEPYAKGPGWFAEGDSKALQLLKKDYLSALELSIKPPMIGDADLLMTGLNLVPGGFTPRNNVTGSGKGAEPLFNVATNLPAVSQEIMATEDRIKKAYNTDLFLMLSQQQVKAGVSATEINARLNEGLRILGPVTERLQDEFLTLIIERVYNILDRAGAFPPLPPEMEDLIGEDVKVEYISPLAQAQKMSGIVSMEQAIGFVANMAQIWPEVTKAIDPMGTFAKYMDFLGAPADMRRSPEEVEAIIAQEQEAMLKAQQEQEAMQVAQTLPNITAAAKNATEAANDGNPALQEWLGM